MRFSYHLVFLCVFYQVLGFVRGDDTTTSVPEVLLEEGTETPAVSPEPKVVTQPNETDYKKLIIVDTDAGTDDGVAILTLLSHEKLNGNVKTVMFTTVSGNIHVQQVGINVLKVLKTMNRLDIPVYQGVNDSLMRTPWNSYFHGEDGFGDFDYPDPPSSDIIRKEHAVNAMIKAVSDNPGKISLVCLGPLTNVALAARMCPSFFKNLKEIFVLGGSDSGVGNIIPGVEFNFYMDPDAAYIVFKEVEKAGKMMTLVTWETVARRNRIDVDWRKTVMGAIKSPAIDLMTRAENKYLQGEYWESADPILMSVFLNEDIIDKAEEYHVDVETCGEYSRGAIFVDYDFNQTLVKNVRLIQRINIDKYKEFLLTNFRGSANN